MEQINYAMRRILYTILPLVLCTACWWIEPIDDPYPDSEQSAEYKSKLYYTTTDGESITPKNLQSFGIDILDMSYENGQGVITFDGIARRIGNGAFKDCDNLKSITLPDSIRVVGIGAFENCINLEEVNLPDSLIGIQREAFAWCTKLSEMTIPRRVEVVEGSAFIKCTELRAFKGSHASKDGRTLIIDGSVVAFASAGVEEYNIPEEATAVADESFMACENLRRVLISDNVTTIGNSAFAWCYGLEEVTLGKGIVDIGAEAFRDCLALNGIYIETPTPPSIMISSFSSFNYEEYCYDFLGCDIFVPEGAVEAYNSAEVWSNYAPYTKVNHALQ